MRYRSFAFSVLSVSSVVTILLLLSACQKPAPTDMRTLAPAETLVYLESSDLSEALQVLTQNKTFKDLAEKDVDFSVLKNTQAAIAVTGFETSEKQVTDDASILNFKPRFVFIVDTHAWKPTAVALAENQLGSFVKKTYGADVALEKSEKGDAKIFVWTAKDGRKLISAVSGSVIYVGNDESVIDKCLAIKRGFGENLSSNEQLAKARESASGQSLAFGYISSDGVAQIANLLGVSTAIDASEDDAVRGFVAKTLPVLVQKSVKDVVWTARRTEKGIEDKVFINTVDEVSSVFKETIGSGSGTQFAAARFLPANVDSFTRYNLPNAGVAWKSVLMVASKQTDVVSGKILTEVSGEFFQPYGISDANSFLANAGPEIVTARFDDEGDKSVAIVDVKNDDGIKKSISNEINFKAVPEKLGEANIWKSKDGENSAAFVGGKVILGNSESVLNCLKAGASGENFSRNPLFGLVSNSTATTVTISSDSESALKLVNILGDSKDDAKKSASFSIVETRFGSGGFERKTTSDFGLIGTIVEQFED